MSKKQFALEMGMGTDLKGQNYTKAACRAVHDALHRNYLCVAQAFGFSKDAMIVDIRVGVGNPDAVDINEVAKQAPYGTVTVEAVHGGSDIPMESADTNSTENNITIIANAIVSVSFDVEESAI